jgi:hypothetical protein
MPLTSIRRAPLALAAALLLCAPPTPACGPDLPPTLLDQREAALTWFPEGTLAFELSRIAGPVKDAWTPGEDFGWADQTETLSKAETVLFGEAAASIAMQAREAPDPATARQIAASLSPTDQAYLAGAVAWRLGDVETARVAFTEAAAGAQPRALWADYMLGRMDAEGDGGKAAFARVRAAVTAGAVDPLGLALASLGEEARHLLAMGDRVGALKLYLEQARRGSWGGVGSVRIVLNRALRSDEPLDDLLADRDATAALAAYVYSRGYELSPSFIEDGYRDNGEWDAAAGALVAPGTPPLLARFLDALAARGQPLVGADRFAAAAYREGRYPLATRLAAGAEGPLAAWVRAKLALREGRLDEATREYATAAAGFPADEVWSTNEYDRLFQPQCRVKAEQGVLAIGRSDYREAMALFYAAGEQYWTDTARLAERVLTLDELKAFVDGLGPVQPLPPPELKVSEWDGSEYVEEPPVPIQHRLRDLLARRLVRAGQADAALPYFAKEEVRAEAAHYAEAMQRASAAKGIDRGEALYAASVQMRVHGMEIAGYEGDPDYAEYGGNYDLNDSTTWDADYNPIRNPRKDLALPAVWVGRDEAERMAASRAEPLERFHYRFRAHDLAQQAADALPPRSQAFAMVLCEASRYVVHRDPALAWAAYQRYVREGAFIPFGPDFGQRCAAPDFERARVQQREAEWRATKRQIKAALPWVAGGGLLLLGGLAGWLIARRRRPAAV